QLVRRFARRAGHGLHLRLEHAAPRPAAVAQGARELQAVSSPSEPGELEPGSGHRADQERNVTPEPIARILVGDAGGPFRPPAIDSSVTTGEASSHCLGCPLLADCVEKVDDGALWRRNLQ